MALVVLRVLCQVLCVQLLQAIMQTDIEQATPPEEPVVTLTHSLTKVRSDTPLTPVSSVSLAGNEYESFQVKMS